MMKRRYQKLQCYMQPYLVGINKAQLLTMLGLGPSLNS